MDKYTLIISLLLFSIISWGFTLYSNNKYIQIQEDKNLIPLMNNQFLPSDFFTGNDPYNIECISADIKESDLITKKRTILYSLSGSLSYPCDNTLIDNAEAIRELSSLSDTRCIIKEGETYLCSSN